MSEKNQKMVNDMVKSLVANPWVVASYGRKPSLVQTEEVLPFAPTEVPSSTEGSAVECVIITSDALAPDFQAFADWKTKKGVPTVIRTTSWIESRYSGCDLPERIRNFIRDAYINWGTLWVILGGDTEVIPVRYVHMEEYPLGREVPTDLYYSCLDGNWNDDGDNLFGENQDGVDLYPEVFVGRLPVHESLNKVNEVHTFVNKLNIYEIPPDGGFPPKILFLGADMFLTCDGKENCDSVATHIPTNFIKTKLYECEGNESRETVLAALKEGQGIVYSQGHGSSSQMRVGQESLSRSDFDSLIANGCFSLWLGVSCNLNNFAEDCLAEHFLLNPEGGGVAWIGSSTLDAPYTCLDFDIPFFDSLFIGGKYKVGQTLSCSKLPSIPYAGNFYPWRILQFGRNLLGDPEMAIWTDTPGTLIVTHPTQVNLGPTQFLVGVDDQDGLLTVPVEGALVCLKKGNEDYAYGYTNSFGQITFTFTPESAGEMSIVVTKHNYLP